MTGHKRSFVVHRFCSLGYRASEEKRGENRRRIELDTFAYKKTIVVDGGLF